MVSPAPTTKSNDAQTYPETLYYAKRVSEGGAQPVYKKLLPDGQPTVLSPEPSQKLRDHSPDGFQYGYSGSGPAQLALALLLDATSDPERATAFYQYFKDAKVATWGEDWSIKRSDILTWLKEEEDRQIFDRIGKN